MFQKCFLKKEKKIVCVFKADQSWMRFWPDMRRSRCNLLPSRYSLHEEGNSKAGLKHTLLPPPPRRHFSGTLPMLLLWTAPKSNSIAPHYPPSRSLPPVPSCLYAAVLISQPADFEASRYKHGRLSPFRSKGFFFTFLLFTCFC